MDGDAARGAACHAAALFSALPSAICATIRIAALHTALHAALAFAVGSALHATALLHCAAGAAVQPAFTAAARATLPILDTLLTA